MEFRECTSHDIHPQPTSNLAYGLIQSLAVLPQAYEL